MFSDAFFSIMPPPSDAWPSEVSYISVTGDGGFGTATMPFPTPPDTFHKLSVHWSRSTNVYTVTFTPSPAKPGSRAAAAAAMAGHSQPKSFSKMWQSGHRLLKNGALIEGNSIGLVVDGTPLTLSGGQRRRAWYRNFVIKQQVETVVEEGDPFTVLLRKLNEFDELCTFFRASTASSSAATATGALVADSKGESKVADAKNAPTLSDRVVRMICKVRASSHSLNPTAFTDLLRLRFVGLVDASQSL